MGLKQQIVSESNGHDWEHARHEWHWIDLHDRGEPSGRCICGAPIRYEFILHNVHSGFEVTVGSACVQQFETPMSQEALSAADCFKELLQGNSSRRMNQSLRNFACREKLMSVADARYYEHYGRTRPGTNRFVDARISKINLDFLANLDPERPECLCDRKRFRNFKANLKKTHSGKLCYLCRRRRCDFFAWRHL